MTCSQVEISSILSGLVAEQMTIGCVAAISDSGVGGKSLGWGPRITDTTNPAGNTPVPETWKVGVQMATVGTCSLKGSECGGSLLVWGPGNLSQLPIA